MDDDEFFEYIQKSIMKLYPDAAPVKGKWVVIKCDSGPGRLNAKLLAYLQFHGFLMFPGIPNTTHDSGDSGDGPKLWSISVSSPNKSPAVDRRAH